MSKAKLLVGAMITVFALGTTTGMVSAATKHAPKAKPAPVVSLASGPPASLHCKKGETYVLHTAGKMSWACAKAA